MAFRNVLQACIVAGALLAHPAIATDESAAVPPHQDAVPHAAQAMGRILDHALGLVGIRYRRGGDSAESGFDCSGFVGFVFLENLGVKLPRTSRDISKAGQTIAKTELEPGDLVFFHTMRKAFSHVGIYLGDHLFVHAPRPGTAVRVEDIRSSYWARRYDGARRINPD